MRHKITDESIWGFLKLYRAISEASPDRATFRNLWKMGKKLIQQGCASFEEACEDYYKGDVILDIEEEE